MLDYVDEDSKSQEIRNYIKKISENVSKRKDKDPVTLELMVNINPEYLPHFPKSFQIFHSLVKEAYRIKAEELRKRKKRKAKNRTVRFDPIYVE